MKLTTAAMGLIVLLACQTAAATEIVIDFENFAPGVHTTGVEDGVRVDADGISPQIFQEFGFGTGRVALSNNCCGSFTNWTFSLLTGGLFTFEGFDLGGFSVAGDSVFVSGSRNGASQGVDSYTTSGTRNSGFVRENASVLAGVLVDSLTFRLNNDVNFPVMDNVTLRTPGTPVPAPAPLVPVALLLLLLGLVGTRKRT